MKIKLDYGKSKLEIEVNDENILHILENKPVKPLADIKKRLVESLRDPIGSPGLEEKIKGKKNICIVISDITRAVPTRLILESILPEIHSYGINRDSITILVATGLHRPNEGEELKKLVGEDIFDNYNIVNHMARDKDGCRLIGKTKKGTPIILNSTYLDSDFKMLTGLIEPHFMAGFSGGRKAICPGISYVDMFKHFHGPVILEAPKTTTGVIDGNPFHEEATEIARKAGVDFLANVTINKNKEITGVFAGDLEAAFLAGVKFCLQSSIYRIDREADIVITTGGGYPLDINLYQAVKGMVGAMPAVKQGGMIILAAKCIEEIGSKEFIELLTDEKDLDRFIDKIKDKDYFKLDQWELEKLIKARKRAEVYLYSDCLNECSYAIPPGTLVQVDSLEDAVNTGLERFGRNATISIIPEGPYIIPVMDGQH